MLQLNVFFVYSLILLEQCCSLYVGYKPRRLRGKLTRLDSELTMDVIAKVKSIQHIRRVYYTTKEFQLAEIVYVISRKRRQMLLYHERSYDSQTDTFQRIRLLTEIQQLGMDIDHLIQMIDNWELNQEKRSDMHDRMDKIVRAGQALSNLKEKRTQKLMAQINKFVAKDTKMVRDQIGPDDGFDTEG